MAGYKQVTAKAAKSGKTMKTAEVRCTTNGGYVVKLCHESSDMSYHKPDEHALGPEDGGKVLALVGKHLGIKGAAEEEDEEEHEGEED